MQSYIGYSDLFSFSYLAQLKEIARTIKGQAPNVTTNPINDLIYLFQIPNPEMQGKDYVYKLGFS